jgi:hypothetical protein
MKKNTIFFTVLMVFVILFNRCAKEPTPFENLPSEVNLGESVIYLNGQLESNYRPDFKYIEINKIMNYGFYDSVDLKINILGFGWLPLSSGDFELHEERILFVKALTNFDQVISEDLKGYSYKLIDADEGFFNVESLDTVQHIVKGRFQAKFKRTSKNGNRDLGLPKILLFQGVFHEQYEVL